MFAFNWKFLVISVMLACYLHHEITASEANTAMTAGTEFTETDTVTEQKKDTNDEEYREIVWYTYVKLIVMVLASTSGITSCVVFVASFLVEYTICIVYCVFLAAMSFADLLLSFSMFSSVFSILLVSQESGNNDVLCRLIYFLTLTSTYANSMLFMLVAMESCCRFYAPKYHIHFLTTMTVGFITMSVFIVSGALAGLGVYSELDYDYCHREHHGNSDFRVLTLVVFHIVPVCIAFSGFVATAIAIRKEGRTDYVYRHLQQFNRDVAFTNLHLFILLLYVLVWTPYQMVVFLFPNASDDFYYGTTWFGACRALISTGLYAILNASYRRAFKNVLMYACCRNTDLIAFTNQHNMWIEQREDIRTRQTYVSVMIHSAKHGRLAPPSPTCEIISEI